MEPLLVIDRVRGTFRGELWGAAVPLLIIQSRFIRSVGKHNCIDRAAAVSSVIFPVLVTVKLGPNSLKRHLFTVYKKCKQNRLLNGNNGIYIMMLQKVAKF